MSKIERKQHKQYVFIVSGYIQTPRNKKDGKFWTDGENTAGIYRLMQSFLT